MWEPRAEGNSENKRFRDLTELRSYEASTVTSQEELLSGLGWNMLASAEKSTVVLSLPLLGTHRLEWKQESSICPRSCHHNSWKGWIALSSYKAHSEPSELTEFDDEKKIHAIPDNYICIAGFTMLPIFPAVSYWIEYMATFMAVNRLLIFIMISAN